MRVLLLLCITGTALSQAGPRIQISHTTENLRGVSAVSRQIAWASGTHGTYLRTIDGGRTWTAAQVPDAGSLDFRGVVAFSAEEAFLISAGPGDQSRIYHTSDGGQHWELEFTDTNPKGFFDSMAFWNRKHGIVLGDPIPDESGKLKFELLLTDDGQTWYPIPPSRLPEALEGEGAFAASNTCLAILHSFTGMSNNEVKEKGTSSAVTIPKNGSSSDGLDSNIWFATGGKAARVFHSQDRGQTWQVFNTPILHGADSAGIFSIVFRDRLHGVIAGGDYKHPKDDGPNLAFTHDGGQTWALSELKPQAYFSAVAYDQRVNEQAIQQEKAEQDAERQGKKIRIKPEPPQRLFIAGQDFIFDFRPPASPRRIGARQRPHLVFNAISPFPEGAALVVGPKGVIAFVP